MNYFGRTAADRATFRIVMQRAENVETRMREARKELKGRIALANPVVWTSLREAENAGLSELDTLLLLCVNLVEALEAEREQSLDLVNKMPPAPIVIPEQKR